MIKTKNEKVKHAKINGKTVFFRRKLALSAAFALLIFFSLNIILFVSPLKAGNFDKSSAGTAAGQFLKMVVGARGAAMGEAYSALSNDAYSIYWNPATLIRIKKESYAFMHSPYLASSSYEYLAYAKSAGQVGNWGFSLQYLDYGSIKRTELSGIENGKFKPYDMALTIGFSCYISGYKKDPEKRFVLGANGKLVRSKIDNVDNTVSADIGVLFPEMFSGKFIMALSAHNIMGTLRLDLKDYPLPLIIRLGSVTRLSKYYVITTDITAPNDNVPYLSMGNELNVFITKDFLVSLRGGFNTRAIFDVYGFRNITFGGGIKYKLYSLDYSFSPYGYLGNAHRISLGVNF